jgi:hypothetical protein
MAEGHGIDIAEEARLLVERVAASSYFTRSARLKDLLHYLSDRVLEDEVADIREHEVGHKVFGRPADYDTSADNIVRVHASMLRKRLEQYFATEGAAETRVIEIPKGNYAPVFRERIRTPDPSPALREIHVPAIPASPPRPRETGSNILAWILAATTLIFAVTTIWMWRHTHPAAAPAPSRPTVTLFWSRIFAPDRQTDLVLDDSAVALYQELTGKQISLSEYFDRSYLRRLTGDNGLDAELASTLVLRRQSSYANNSFLWKIMQLPESKHWRDTPRFARDYSFRELRADNALLLGNSRTNPWIQAFEARTGIRWRYDKSGVYYPVDLQAGGKSYPPPAPGEVREGYCSLTLLPNLGATGSVLIVSATGGSALNSAAEFLSDNQSLAALRSRLPGVPDSAFPHFEALISLTGRSGLPRSSSIVAARALK